MRSPTMQRSAASHRPDAAAAMLVRVRPRAATPTPGTASTTRRPDGCAMPSAALPPAAPRASMARGGEILREEPHVRGFLDAPAARIRPLRPILEGGEVASAAEPA
jgi:hypothetical protein